MTVSRWLRILAATGGVLVSGSAIAIPGSAQTRDAAGAAAGELVYVASAGTGPVTAYAASSNGSVTPVRTIDNPNTPGTVWDPWGVTFDSTGHLYVQSFLSSADTFVFPPGANGATPASRIFVSQVPDNTSVAVDAKGFEYVLGTFSESQVAVSPPGASGTPGGASPYFVPPVRTFGVNFSFGAWPDQLSTDSAGELLAAVSGQPNNAIEAFSGGANDSASPVRVISGPDTGLDCATSCKMSITFSPLTGRIYAAISDGAATRICVFAGSASGDARPVRTIEGPATGLPGMFITGIADSQLDGTIYAMAGTSEFGGGTGRVNAYGRLASGNAAPLRSFTDSGSGFAAAEGIAITGALSAPGTLAAPRSSQRGKSDGRLPRLLALADFSTVARS
jgi:hypothetical protein